MFITVEGAIGVGKTSLVNALAARPGWQRLHEEYDTNPFLHALYEDPQHYGLHAQITFLFLQDRQMQHAARLLTQGVNVISDFHPLKSLVFTPLIVARQDHPTIIHLYQRLFAQMPHVDLMIYLKASEVAVLGRIRKRGDEYTRGVDPHYIRNLLRRYDQFFKHYKGPILTINSTSIDYVNNQADLEYVAGVIDESLMRATREKIALRAYTRSRNQALQGLRDRRHLAP